MSSRIIADTYVIEREIGSGGGGVVYLARHLRLNKQVVLKGDKRSLTANQDVLRREVDALKNLSHTYIPQVYDYISENDMVYTVMDYVEGESFNYALNRGERFQQARIVAWAGQLLEAVSYLHKQPPHGILHADIKPANIMRTPQDDIRLIDFNIALMLGEEGAVAVGMSFGYASPELYDIDYSGGTATLGSAKAGAGTAGAGTAGIGTAGTGTAGIGTAGTGTAGIGTVKLAERTEIVGYGGSPPEAVSPSGGGAHPGVVSPSGGGGAHPGVVSPSGGGAHPGAVSPSGSGVKRKLLDARSDIYSIGATLYHLITGKRPERKPFEVATALRQCCSLALAQIVEKAMNPNSDLRYQSADEMLYDIRHLRDNDPRILKWKRVRAVVSVVLTLTFLLGSASAFIGYRQTEQIKHEQSEKLRIEALKELEEEEALRIAAEKQREIEEQQRKEAERLRRLEEMRVLAASSADSLRSGDRQGAIAIALDAVPSKKDIGVPYVAEAKKALADALGIYDLSDGYKTYRTVILPSETLKIALAPDGKSFAAMSLGKLSVFDTKSGALKAQLPTVESGLADALYIDNGTIVYAAPEGLTIYDLISKSEKLIGGEATTISVSADGSTIAAVNRDDTKASVYGADGESRADVSFGNRRMWVAANDRFGDPGDNIFKLNHDGSLLAVSFSNGGLEIFDLTGGQNGIEIIDKSDYMFFEGGFYGKYFAFSATNDEESLFAVIDTEKSILTISTSLPGRIGAFADANGVYMSYNGTNVSVDPETARQTPIGYDPRDQSAGGFRVEGSLNSPVVRVLKYESNANKEIFNYGPEYSHDEARINAGGDRIMLFSIDSFIILSIDGSIINETPIPNAGQIYDQLYRRDGGASFLEVIYYDGTVHKYSGDNGTLIATDTITPPDPSLYEEFTTDNFRITSSLHGAPVAYDILTGELVRELEKDAYLTYVTQIGQNVITEYISADGDRYGLLLDGETCETLAYIPGLCDVLNGRLLIDIKPTGSLRMIDIYSQEELIEMARAWF